MRLHQTPLSFLSPLLVFGTLLLYGSCGVDAKSLVAGEVPGVHIKPGKRTSKHEKDEARQKKSSQIGTANFGVDKTVSSIEGGKTLTLETMSQNLRKMEYAVRGRVVIAADNINDSLAAGGEAASRLPFDHVVYTNIGNPHSVGQRPLTWPRQVLALVDLPNDVGIDHPNVTDFFPEDAVRRAREIKEGLGCGTGAYSHSQGAPLFRKDIAAFIEERDDGVPSDPGMIFMTNGASSAILMVLEALLADESCGVMIPIPQYPIYSASIDLLGGQKVGYYLDENTNWSLNMRELERALLEARSRGIKVNAFVLINPGNPTGQLLSERAVRDIVLFCAEHKLVLLADEVYQSNIYEDGATFTSCKKAAYDMGLLENDAIELFSFHSTSKGLLGECGRRGGYMELAGIHNDVKDQLYKLASASLCSSTSGQVMTSLMCRGPVPGDESYESYEAEKKAVFESLKRKSRIVSEGLDSIPGISCQPAQGAMYCFPSVEIPPLAIEAARRQGVSPDTLYSISLLESTGICVVPASGFGQEEGRFGFRITFLPPEDEVLRCVDAIRAHHESFCAEYS